ncbi:hybrid sensor histidine kinase/response regulator [Chondromyces apiculatus]|uniref:histidine kinase n=1 Tax=Chondromyces apiculatus DSM 436 TaxID=1192034 RepID=A0A017SUK6_9BACT|nr:hybrid sensor histidine kinase/response regulator [Chondromyces apiculatus]EYF00295.1 Hypothetical protein CAP_0985 [Chondromyces apiculatus DSM 436]
MNPTAAGEEWLVLLIDDSLDDRDEIRRLLLRGSDRRYRFLHCETGERALDLLRDDAQRGRIDAILLDDNLPDATSLEVLEAMPRDDGDLAVPTIVLTGANDPRTATNVLRAGAHDFVGKEWMTPASLTRALENARERHSIAGELRAARGALATSEGVARDRLAELESIYALAPVGLCFTDASLRFLSVNEGLASIDGISVERYLGRTVREVLAPAVADAVEPLYEHVIATGEALTNIEIRVHTPAGSAELRDFLASYRPVLRGDGEVRGVNVVIQDISALKRTEAALRQREERLRLALEAARMGWWDWDIVPDVLTWSDEFHTLFGRSPEPPRGGLDSLLAPMHPDDRPRGRQALLAALEHDTPYDLEFRIVRPDGALRWVASKGRVLRDPEGRPLRMTGIDLDITDRKEIEERREAFLSAEQAARQELERLGRMKDEFLATLSHELRTPLNAILGWSQILRGRAANEDAVRKGLEVIDRNARVQAQLVSDLLDMNRILSGKLRLDVRPVSLAQVAQAAVETVRLAADARGVALKTRFLAEGDVIQGDPDRLQQVLWNLLSNSIKFTERGGTVSITLARHPTDPTHLQVTVRDTGQGIDPEFLPHLFGRFRQADTSAARTHGGLGLGLAIVRQLAEMHGGTITADSKGRGQGSTFTLTLPTLLAEALVSDDGPASTPETPRPPAPRALEPLEIDLTGLRVLVIDDQADAREFVERLLAERGATTAGASSAEEALTHLHAALPDVIVCDIGMPGTDGYAFARRLRARPATQGGLTPAVALTAFARNEDRERALAAGYQEHLSKPPDLQALVATVARLGRQRLAS